MNRSIIACVLVAGACGVTADSTDEDLLELHGHGPRRLQAGTGITLFETTDDDYAIYQQGQQVFAATAGCAPELIADVPAGNTAFVFPVGAVAFVWTNPDRTLPGFGVSPLYVWSAATGSHLASPSSSIGTLAVSATSDGDRVIFTSNSPASGVSGDIVLASTDLGSRTTIASGIAMSFGSGPCVPRLAFRGDSDDVVGVSCPAGTTSATFSTWHHGHRTDLPQPVSTPPRLRLDPAHERAVTTLAGSQSPIVIDQHGHATVVANVAATNVFFGGDGAVIYLTQPVAGGLQRAFRAPIDRQPRPIADLVNVNLIAFGSTGLAVPVTSPDGRFLSYYDATEPSFGLATDVIVADVRGNHAPITVDTSPGDILFGLPFTKDSDYALYARLDFSTLAVGPLFGAGPRGNRQYSDGLGWSWEPGAGSTVIYNDHTDPTFVAADLKSVDLSRATLAPRLIAPQANVTFFSSHRGHGVVYTIDTGPDAGLYDAAID